MRYFLGIDGGQTTTTAVIGDESGRVVGYGRGGPCNHVEGPGGQPKFLDAIGGCVGEASTNAGLDAVEFAAVCAGFSGGPADKQTLLRKLIETPHLFVTTDAVIALSGATAGLPGIITVAGTGSICYGRNADKKVARAGGWGYVFGDEGGGFDLVRQALRAILRHEEGWGPETNLREILLNETGATDANDLLHRFYSIDFPRPKVAAYAKLVDQAAAHGDLVGRNIIMNAAQQLASITSAVRTQIFKENELAKIAYIGGVFRSQMLLERFRMLVEFETGNQVCVPSFSPAVGALIEAYALAGLRPAIAEVPPQEK